MTFYCYNKNGYYTGTFEATVKDGNGSWFAPARSTQTAPPVLSEGQLAKWNGSNWDVENQPKPTHIEGFTWVWDGNQWQTVKDGEAPAADLATLPTQYAVKIQEYKATAPEPLHFGSQGSYGVQKLILSVDEKWKSLTISATFIVGEYESVTVLSVDNVVNVPPEATRLVNKLDLPRKVVFSGVKDGVKWTTNAVRYTVEYNGVTEGKNSDSTPSTADQMLLIFKENIDSTMQVFDERCAEVLEESSANAKVAIERYYEPHINAEGMLVWERHGEGLPEISSANITGPQGGYYMPRIDSEGNLSWSPSQPNMQESDGANIIGPRGGYYTPVISAQGIVRWEKSIDSMPDIPDSNISGLIGDVNKIVDDHIAIHNLDIAAHHYLLGLVSKIKESVAQAQEIADKAADAASDVAYVIKINPSQKGTVVYNGEIQSPEWASYNNRKLEISGTTSATDVGTYTATFTPFEGYTWEDGSRDTRVINWSLSRQPISIPTQSGKLVYDGTLQTPTWDNYDAERLQLEFTQQINAGAYKATFTPTANFCWADGSARSIEVDWELERQPIATIPTQDGTLYFNDGEQSPAWNGYDSVKLELSGDTSGKDAKTYSTLFTPTPNYKWEDGTVEGKVVKWAINKFRVETLPSQSGGLLWNGEYQEPEWNDYDPKQLSIGGATQGRAAGLYYSTFVPSLNYCWADGTSVVRIATWEIRRNVIKDYPNVVNAEMTYTGEEQAPAFTNYDESKMSISGKIKASAVGEYSTDFTPSEGYCWANGSFESYSVQWAIVNIPVSIPSQSGNLTYNGTEQSPSWSNYDPDTITLSFEPKVNAGTYDATFKAKIGYIFDNGSSSVTVPWKIGRVTINIPTVSGTRTYNGGNQEVAFNGYDSNAMTLGGITSATNAGSYTASFVPTSNYQWSDGSTNGRDVQWTISKVSVVKPYVTANRTYSGGNQAPGIGNYDSAKMTPGGTQSATNAGSYTITYTLKDTTNLQWSDGSTSSVSLGWSIARKSVGAKPKISANRTYNGSSQSPGLSGMDWDTMSRWNTTSATNAGSYTLTIGLKDTTNRCWSDGSTGSFNLGWSIGKANATITFETSYYGTGQYYDDVNRRYIDVVHTVANVWDYNESDDYYDGSSGNLYFDCSASTNPSDFECVFEGGKPSDMSLARGRYINSITFGTPTRWEPTKKKLRMHIDASGSSSEPTLFLRVRFKGNDNYNSATSGIVRICE